MKITLIQVPYHMGREQVTMGLGPGRYLEAGAESNLSRLGFQVRVETVRRSEPFSSELEAIVDVDAHLAERVREAVAGGALPLVLGGDCNTCLGTLAGLGSSKVGIIWFDAHGDFNTPETSASGFFDGMALAVATGHCYSEVRERIGLSVPVPEAHAIHVGGRDLDPGEGERLQASGVRAIPAASLRDGGLAASLLPALTELASRVEEIYLHLDMDVLDPEAAPANEYSTPGGLSLEEMEEAIRMIGAHFKIGAAALTAFNPEHDKEGKTVEAGFRLMETIGRVTSDE